MNGEDRNPSGSALSLVKKILEIQRCHGKDELLEALELTREALEPENHSNSKIFAVLHRLYAGYLKELEVPPSNSDYYRNLIVGHAKKAVSLCPNSTEYRHFYASLLFEEDTWVPDEEVIRQCRRALHIGAADEDPYWTLFLMDDDGCQDDESKVEKVTDDVIDLMLKVKLREEERRRRQTSQGRTKSTSDHLKA